MATGSSASSPVPAGSSAPSSDWPAQAADTIEQVVGSIRDKTTGPAITAARWAVYGTFAALVGLAVAILLAISAVRIMDVYLPDGWVGEQHTWVAHLIVGSVFTLLGMGLWSQRSSRPKD
jgi:hypothetical protein